MATLGPWLHQRLWIGFLGRRTEFYLPLARTPGASAVLAGLAIRPDTAARRALARHGAEGRLMMIALTVDRDRFSGVTLYLRQPRPLLGPALAFYPALALARDHWSDADTGSAVSLDLTGCLIGEALYHYTAPYWSCDQALIARLGEVLARRDLPIGTAKQQAELIGIATRALTRRMIGLSAAAGGGDVRLKLYQSAAPHVRQYRESALSRRSA